MLVSGRLLYNLYAKERSGDTVVSYIMGNFDNFSHITTQRVYFRVGRFKQISLSV